MRILWHDNSVLIFAQMISISLSLFCFASVKIFQMPVLKNYFHQSHILHRIYSSPSSSSWFLKRVFLSLSRCCRVWLWEVFSLSSSSCVLSLDAFSVWSSFRVLSWEDFSFWSLSCVLLCEAFSFSNRSWIFSWAAFSVWSCCCVLVCEAFSFLNCFCVFSSESFFSCRCCWVSLWEIFSHWSSLFTFARASFVSVFWFPRFSSFSLYTVKRSMICFSWQEMPTLQFLLKT